MEHVKNNGSNMESSTRNSQTQVTADQHYKADVGNPAKHTRNESDDTQNQKEPSSRTMYLVRQVLKQVTEQAYALRDRHLEVCTFNNFSAVGLHVLVIRFLDLEQAFSGWTSSLHQPVSNFARKLVSPPLINSAGQQDEKTQETLDISRYYEIQGPFVDDDEWETKEGNRNGTTRNRQSSNNRGSHRSFITISSAASNSSHLLPEFASTRLLRREKTKSKERKRHREHRFTVQLPGLEFDPLFLSTRSSVSSSDDRSTGSEGAERSSALSESRRSVSPGEDYSRQQNSNQTKGFHASKAPEEETEESTNQHSGATQELEYSRQINPSTGGIAETPTGVSSTTMTASNTKATTVVDEAQSKIVTSLGQRLRLVSILPPPSEEQIERARNGQLEHSPSSFEDIKADLNSILNQFSSTVTSNDFALRCRPTEQVDETRPSTS